MHKQSVTDSSVGRAVRGYGLALGLVLLAGTALAGTTPSKDFVDNGDGTVTHSKTGLTWKRCVEGQSWTGSSCTGTSSFYTWSQANALTSGSWRLPTIAELLTIVEREAYDPTLNTAIFPVMPAPQVWSATTDASYPAGAWYIDFKIGNQFSRTKDYTYQVRLVRGGKALDASGQYTPTSEFTDNGNGTVTHSRTGLTWKRCPEGQSWSAGNCSGTATTYSWDQAVALNAGGWRLPTENELLGLIEWSTRGYPAVNTSLFPGTYIEGQTYAAYWSASAYFDNPLMAWRVVFGYGYDLVTGKQGGLHRALLVRDTPLTGNLTSDADRVFNWAETGVYAQFFHPAGAATQDLAGYAVRYYSGSGNYLGAVGVWTGHAVSTA
jgi:hypothetical protein